MEVEALSRFALKPGVLLGFAMVNERTLGRGMVELGEILRRLKCR